VWKFVSSHEEAAKEEDTGAQIDFSRRMLTPLMIFLYFKYF